MSTNRRWQARQTACHFFGFVFASLLGIVAGTGLAAGEPLPGTPERPLIVAQGDSLGTLANSETGNKQQGLSIDSLNAVAARAGIAIRCETWPWSRAQVMVQQGAADMFITVPTTERRTYALFAREPMFHADTVVLYGKDGPQADRIAAARTLDDLKGIVFAAYLGSGWTSEELHDQQVTWVNDRPTVLSMLAAGHADATLSDSLLSHSIVAAEGLEAKIATHRIETPHPHYYYAGIRRSLVGVESLVARLDAATAAAEADGTLAAILQRYSDTDKPMP
jgi:ABC-type amino acid transport substrate-binding protein